MDLVRLKNFNSRKRTREEKCLATAYIWQFLAQRKPTTESKYKTDF